MTDLTLRQLRRAMRVISTSKKFKNKTSFSSNHRQECLMQLRITEQYMLGESKIEPMDPREFLKKIGYRL